MPGEKVERRLAAILAADVAGYSRLMGADEEGTLARLKASRKVIVDPAIAEHKGRIVKTTGDGMLVEFASSVDALTCAIVIQEKMAERSAGGAEPRIVFRIGINVGEVIIDGDDIFGDGVNVAARVENECEPGGVCISGNAFEQIRGKTRFAFDDLGEKTLKNIERPVRLYAVRATATTAAISTTPSNAGDPLPLPDKPSIAVLPFHNMSGDPEQEYFADGMVDEIITALSRFRSLFVIARSSTFIYKGQAIDIKRVSRDLGVRYVLEGSLRKGGGRVRVTAQLIDALSGAHLWADRYDRDLTDVFAVQDEITASVAAVIEPALAEAERQRVLRKSPASLDAWETYQRGLWHFYKFSADENKTAQVYFLRAIATHPDFAPGHYGLALAQQLDFWLYSTRSWTDITGLALKEAQIGVSLDDKDSMAHAMLSFVQQLCGEWEPAIAEGRTAISLNPNSVWSMMAMGVALGWGGYPKDGVDYLRGAMRASPHDPMTRFWIFWTGIFQYHLQEYEATLISMREVIRVGSALDGHAVRWVAQALAQLGRVPEAKAELERAIAISPVFFDKFVRQRPPWYRPDDYALSIEGLRKAGWAG